MFNQSLVDNYLRWYTADYLYLRGLSYDISMNYTDEKGESRWYVGNRKDVCKSAASHLNNGLKVRIHIEAYTKKAGYYVSSYNFNISPSDEEIAREKVKKSKESFRVLRDFQRTKVYKWEWRYIENGDRLDNNQIEELLNDICTLFNAPPVSFVVTKAKKATSSYHGWCSEIRLAAGWGRKKRVVLHEVAHHLAKGHEHRENFVGAILDLYELYLDCDRNQMIETLEASGIKYNENWHKEMKE